MKRALAGQRRSAPNLGPPRPWIRGPLPGLIQRTLLLGTALGWFALELVLARMVQPARTVRCFRILWLFVQAHRSAGQLLGPLLVGQRGRIGELRRYARNCIVLMALQPERSGASIAASADSVLPAALYGACIPLYDGCFDQMPTRRARAFAEAAGQALAVASAAADLTALAPLLEGSGASPDDAANWQRLIAQLGRWLQHQPPDRRRLVLGWMAQMNAAQLASLSERNVTLSLSERRRLSSLKGGVSFLLLRCLCLPERSDPTGATDQERAALLQAAAVAQWIDDYGDVRSDQALGIHTYIGRLDGAGKASGTIRQGLQDTALALRSVYGQRAERFIVSLSLYYAIKRSLRARERLERLLNR